MALPSSFSILKPLLLLLVTLTLLGCPSGHVKCVERERLALLNFKKSFVSFNQSDKLSSWKSTKEDCCRWDGIICHNLTGNVVSLNLSSQFLESYQLRPSLLELQHLSSLDLSDNEFTMKIPDFIGSFSKLTFLHLGFAGFFGKIPPHLGNLTSIQTLELRDNQLSGDNFQWLSHLSSVKDLDMSGNNFSEATDWLSTIMKLPLLSSFCCSSCSLPPPVFLSTSPHHVNFSTSLEILDLSSNNLSISTLYWFLNSTRNFAELHLSYLNLEDPFPGLFIQNMNSLESLDLSGNLLEGGIFQSVGNLCNLKELYASNCGLKQSLVDILQALTSCASSSLESLDLRLNNLTGTIPPMLKFQLLTKLYLNNNQLNGFQPQNSTNLPELQVSDIFSGDFINGSLQNTLCFFPASLSILHLPSNFLNCVLSDVHFANFSGLSELYLSNNPNLTISFRKPPLQLGFIGLRSCKLGPNFPSWLLTQNRYSHLDISNSKISGSIPVGFWKNLPSSLVYLNISFNKFNDVVPNLPFHFAPEVIIDLSSNSFFGLIPFSLFKANVLFLSENKFSGFAPFPHPKNFSASLPSISTALVTNVVDISNNFLSGKLPKWLWFHLPILGALDLTNNNLSGTIPSSLGNTSILYVLRLSNNNFSGPLPLWLKSCPKLSILDLSRNRLSGNIPSWLGLNLKHLLVLSLRSNNLTGSLPANICHLDSLQILDLSYNQLFGNIPSCVHNFSAMAHDVNLSSEPFYVQHRSFGHVQLDKAYFYYAFIKWKGMDRQFQKTLDMVKLIDLSNNNLSGEIPTALTSLFGLKSLDLSSNHLNGCIPDQIGQLKSLEFLNLSYNGLSCQIPPSLADISELSMMNLSHNNLLGRIPTSTQLQGFNSTAYADNPGLCGPPLLIKCPGDEDSVQVIQPSTDDENEEGQEWLDAQCFYAGLGTGFAFGFLVILGTLSFITKWRHAFFHFASDFTNWILVVVAFSSSKISWKPHF